MRDPRPAGVDETGDYDEDLAGTRNPHGRSKAARRERSTLTITIKELGGDEPEFM